MTLRPVLAVLLALVLFTARAQTPLGQPSLDESKVQMWCATVRFVYDDAGRPNLKSTVRCEAGNLDALATSIRPDSLRVYSLLYQPIEGRGAIYQGKKDNPARLAALAKGRLGAGRKQNKGQQNGQNGAEGHKQRDFTGKVRVWALFIRGLVIWHIRLTPGS